MRTAQIRAALRRLHYVWSWRLRYWWLDTPGGERARLAISAVAALVVIVQVVRMIIAAVGGVKP